MGYVAAANPDPKATSPGLGMGGPEPAASGAGGPLRLGELRPGGRERPRTARRTRAVGLFACPSDRDAGLYTVVDDMGTRHCRVPDQQLRGVLRRRAGDRRFPRIVARPLPAESRGLPGRCAGRLGTTIAVGERGACLVKTPGPARRAGVSASSRAVTPAASYGSIGRGGELVVARADDVPLNGEGTAAADFYSPHPGGANFLFADGSVRFVKQSVSLPVYRAALHARRRGDSLRRTPTDRTRPVANPRRSRCFPIRTFPDE